MSIVLKSNQLNTLIYKYLLEAGLSHSAYTLFNQAALAQPLQEYRFDVRSGHLLSILEKGLIYAKIEAHVNFSEYMECNEPFYLLKSHTCKVTEKVKKERSEVLYQLQEQINQGIKRTNSVYNTAIANRDFEQIVYEAKGKKYFQKFPKIRLPTTDTETQNSSGRFILGGTDVFTLLYNSESCEMDLLKYDSINEAITLQRIFPSIKLGELAKPIEQSITNEQVIQLFKGNHVTLFDLRKEESQPVEFTIPVQSQLTKIEPNPQIPQLVCFKNQYIYFVININSFKAVSRGQGKFFWRAYDEYLLIRNNTLQMCSLQSQEPLQTFESEIKWDQILFNSSRNLFAAISYSNKAIYVFTLQSRKPLFIFTFEDRILRQAMFITSNSVDYLCWFTDQSIKIFDLSLNAYSKVIEMKEYETQIQQICALQKADKDQMYLLALGTKNLLVYDIGNSKIQRVQVEDNVLQLKQLSLSRVGMVTDSNIYFLVGQYIDQLFK